MTNIDLKALTVLNNHKIHVILIRSSFAILSHFVLFFSQRPDVLTTGAGVPIGDKVNSMTAGPRGPLLVQDVVFADEMAHFDRERIPERVVHAKGAGECEQRHKEIVFLCSK